MFKAEGRYQLRSDLVEPKPLEVQSMHDLDSLTKANGFQPRDFLFQLIINWNHVFSRKCAQGHVQPHDAFEFNVVVVVVLVSCTGFPQH